MNSSSDELLREHRAFYRARASEYDEWFLRQGRYDRGRELNQRWFAEVAAVEQAPEMARGTGWWTRQLVSFAESLTAIDASREVLALNEARIGPGRVNYGLWGTNAGAR